jgi:hypothetical protein
MSARIIFNRVITARDAADGNQLTVSYQLLLVLYTIIPLCLLLQLFDEWFWQGFLQQHLPTSPKQFLLFQIIFGTPHIIASSLLLASNPEYLRHYKSKLILMTLAIITIFGVGSLLIPYKVLYVMAAVWTVYHVLKQQLGVGRGLYRIPDWFFFLLLWLSVTAGIFVYIGIFLQNSLDQQQLAWIKLVAGILCAGLVCSAFYGQHYINTSAGRWFLWANVFLVVSSYYLFTQQYFFLAILVPRLVHDATAFIFYVVHDYNKHSKAPQNLIIAGSGTLPSADCGVAFVSFILVWLAVMGMALGRCD